MTTQLVRSCPKCNRELFATEATCIRCRRAGRDQEIDVDKIGEERDRYPRRRKKREVER